MSGSPASTILPSKTLLSKITLLKLPLCFLVMYLIMNTLFMLTVFYSEYDGLWDEIMARFIWETTATTLTPLCLSFILSMCLLKHNIIDLTLNNGCWLLLIATTTALIVVLVNTNVLYSLLFIIDNSDLFTYNNEYEISMAPVFIYELLQIIFSLLLPMALIAIFIQWLQPKFTHSPTIINIDIKRLQNLHLVYCIVPIALVFSAPCTFFFELLAYHNARDISLMLLEYKVVIISAIAIISAFILYQLIKPRFTYSHQQLQIRYVIKPLLLITLSITLCHFAMNYITYVIVSLISNSVRSGHFAEHPDILPSALSVWGVGVILMLALLYLLTRNTLVPYFTART